MPEWLTLTKTMSLKTRIKERVRIRVEALVLWAIDGALERLRQASDAAALRHACAAVEATERTCRAAAVNSVETVVSRLTDQLKALQACDIDFKNAGKIILIAQVAGRDIVKIINIPRQISMNDWRRMIDDVEHRFGAKPSFIDEPSRLMKDWLRRGH